MKNYKRRAVFGGFRSSLASETLFLAIFDEKTQATGCFQRFSLVARKRNAVLAIFEEKTRATGYFSHFLHFAHERRMIFSFFLLSSVDDECFFPEKSIIYSCILYYFPHIRYILSKYMKFNIKVNNYIFLFAIASIIL